MSQRTRGWLIIAIIGLLVIADNPVLAMGNPMVSLRSLCQNTNTIVAGRVISVEYTGDTIRYRRSGREYEFGLWRATLTVEKMIKGRVSRKNILVEFPGPKKDQQFIIGTLFIFERLNPGERAVLFLRTSDRDAEAYVFENNYQSAVRIADTPDVTRLLQRRSTRDKPEQIASLLSASMMVADREKVGQALSDLVNLQGKQASPAIKALLDRSRDAAIRGDALTALLQVGDNSRLSEAVEFVLSENESDRAVLGAKQLLSSRMGLVTDPQLVAKHYFPLLQDHRSFVRQNAAYAIRKAKLQIAAPLLIKGLKDSDPETRYHCLMGLAATLGWSAPSQELFEKNERDYIELWQRWWEGSGQFEFVEIFLRELTTHSPLVVEKFHQTVETQSASDLMDEAVFQLKQRDSPEFVRRSDYEITPALTRKLLTPDSLPTLYALLEDSAYRGYWPNIAKTICYLGDDPRSVPVIIKYIRRSDDWKPGAIETSYECIGKVTAITWLGFLGGEEAERVLMQAMTPDGAKELAKAWINGPLPVWATTPNEEIVGVIQGSAAIGIVHSQSQQGILKAEALHAAARADSQQRGYFTPQLKESAKAMAIRDLIQSIGMEGYLDRMGTGEFYKFTILPRALEYMRNKK